MNSLVIRQRAVWFWLFLFFELFLERENFKPMETLGRYISPSFTPDQIWPKIILINPGSDKDISDLSNLKQKRLHIVLRPKFAQDWIILLIWETTEVSKAVEMSGGREEGLAASQILDGSDPSLLTWREIRDSWGSCTNFVQSYGLKP